MKFTDEEIKEGYNDAYKKAKGNAFFGEGFKAGVKFAVAKMEKEKISRLDDVSKPRDLLIAYELSQEFDGANPTQGMAEEMVDKFLATYSPCAHSEDDMVEVNSFIQCKCGIHGESC